jgi:hypothetical protein
MAIARDRKLNQGDVVAIAARVDSNADHGSRVYVRPMGYYSSIFIEREHLTFLCPFVEAGMHVALGGNSKQEYKVLAVVGGEWVVIQALGDLGTSLPEPMCVRPMAITSASYPAEAEEAPLEPRPAELEEDEVDLGLPPPPDAPDEPLTTDETAEMEPRRTVDPTLQHGYPFPQGVGFLGDFLLQQANAVTNAYRAGMEQADGK